MTKESIGGLDIELPIGPSLSEKEDLAAAVDMAGHEVASQSVGREKARFQVDDRASPEVAEVGQPESLGEQVEAGLIAMGVHDGQAATVSRDAVTDLGVGEQGVGEGQAGAILFPGRKGDYLGGALD